MQTSSTAPVPGSTSKLTRQVVDPTAAVATLIQEMEGWLINLKRSAAGFTSLQASLLAAQGKVPDGERKKGLPIFEFSAPLIGAESREAVKCAIDLKNVAHEHLSHVLIPIINAYAVDLLDSSKEIGARVNTLLPILFKMTGTEAPPEQQEAI